MPGLSPQLIAQLGLVVHGSGPSPIPVFPPSQLSAFGQSNGVNALRWKANGNATGTTYVIEASFDGATDWTFVDTTSKTRFDHNGQTPGRQVVYRISAKRADRTSAPSNEATVYSGGGTSLSVVQGGQAAA